MLYQPFEQEGLRVDPLVISVDPNTHFNIQPCRFVQNDILISLRDLIDQFFSVGGLVPDSNCGHASPLVIVPKNEGGIRMAVDCREVNQLFKVSTNQLPYQNMLFQQLSGLKFYANIDNFLGYHQLKPSDESSKVKAIFAPFGMYRFLVARMHPYSS